METKPSLGIWVAYEKSEGFSDDIDAVLQVGKTSIATVANVGFNIDSFSASCRKRANKVGIMTAIKDLNNERVYTKKYLENVM